MEYELLRNQLHNTRNLLTTLAGNIDNTLLTFNDLNRNRYSLNSNRYRDRTFAARRNLNNLFQELRNMYPETQRNTTRSNIPQPQREPNNNITSNVPINNPFADTLNNIINNRINNLNSTSNPNPDLIEVTLYNNGNRVVSNMEDVPVYPSLRTLRESSTVHTYSDLDTPYESCTICRERFDDNSIVRKLSCGHIFHINCIDTWFESNITCPVCRADLRDLDESENENLNQTGNLNNTTSSIANSDLNVDIAQV